MKVSAEFKASIIKYLWRPGFSIEHLSYLFVSKCQILQTVRFNITYIDYLYLFSIRLVYTRYLMQVITAHCFSVLFKYFLAFMAELIQMSTANWCYKHVLHCSNIPCPMEMYPLNSGGKNIGFSAIDPDGRKFYHWSSTC